ncbi:helix-turn-helix transcriptional regulator [Alterisphingorhabdus coralli]|uniref:Autoinducer binding domain-containing protein n=1 Tax=Alterisphingorhabdus coralli TaxID=3071408 RepID=A0AA97I1T0_9SPHN|nr:autoinducer binding domain-containing protein [Parasphingorhabdus sp. SCSIO 66989]WOE76397.1 autoinducer binding domain-containing protein [Parasphingorhabdus sp. SCSIO 66989]
MAIQPGFDLQKHLLIIRSTTHTQEVLDRAKDCYLEMGIVRATYHLAGKIRSPISADVQLLSFGFPHDMIERYKDPEFRKNDPIPDIVMQHGQPMTFRDAINVRKLTPEEYAFVEGMEKAGLMHAVGIPLFGRNLRNAYVSFGFTDAAPLEDEQLMAHLMAVAPLAHLQVCNILEEPLENKVTLSARESEVLGLIARGFSAPYIAKIVKVSEATVGTYIRRIFAKLEVTDKVSAVIRALEFGLLRY